MATIDLNHETICINPTDDLTLYDKNNIMSRIEKFLFAICSLDSSDLPVPLSRIEELYYCLVTGDTPPTFEPLSRAEKFLMACLGVYDVNKLPEPLSRSEVLLKKIATGDSNLEDVDNLQSKYEFLLAYIIQNGGIGDFDEYVLNTQFSTLYNTKEKPVKSAILKGQTLVNAWKKHQTYIPSDFIMYDDGFMELKVPKPYFDHIQTDSSLLKPNTKYLLVVEVKNNTLPVPITFFPDTRTVFAGNKHHLLFSSATNGVAKVILTTISDFSTTQNNLRWGAYISFIQDTVPENERGMITVRQMLIEYQDGMETWDIPFFTGMQSVKMPVLTTTGKNLFDIEKVANFNNWVFDKKSEERPYAFYEFSLKPNTTYTFSRKSNIRADEVYACFSTDYGIYDENGGIIHPTNNSVNRTSVSFTTDSNGKIFLNGYGLKSNFNTFISLIEEAQIEEGSIATPYEPYKSNILTYDKTFTQSMFEQGSFAESTAPDTESYENIKMDSSGGRFYSNRIRTKTTHKVISGASYNVKINDGYGIFICFCKNGLYNKILTGGWSTFYNFTFTIPTDCDEMFFALRKIDNSDITVEDYPAMGLEIRQEVTLRGIGKVKDELNLITGELTQRVGEIVLDGTQEYEISSSANGENTYYTQILINNIVPRSIAISSAFPTVTKNLYLPENDFEGMRVTSSGKIQMKILKNKLTSLDRQGFINYFKNNPLKVLFQQNEQSVKTVDLSVVDQDGNDTKLSTFNDITHVTLSSEGLIPEAELEVATKNKEDLEDSSVYTVHTLSEKFNTLYNTEEKPVKSAMLKGQTLVNLASEKNTSIGGEGNITCVLPYKVDKITVYFLDPTYSKFQYFEYDSEGNYIRVVNSYIPSDRVIFISLNDTTIGKIGYLNPDDINTSKNIVAMYGDTRDIKITKYFEGMQSVKMPVLTTTGNNLVDLSTSIYGEGDRKVQTDFIKINPNKTFIASMNNQHGSTVEFYTQNKELIISKNGFTVISPSNAYYLKWTISSQDETADWNSFQIEEGAVATPYEPHKSNILTVNEEVTLRGIGEVKDELNLLTGELTQRISEVVLDGSEYWVVNPNGLVNTYDYYYNIGNKKSHNYVAMLPQITMVDDKFGIVTTLYDINNIGIRIEKDKLTSSNVESFKDWLSQNPITIQYELATESVKTVDLSVVDQDGNDTKLSTFNDITHVTLSSEGLIPEAELEVAEKVPEIAASILTISREQEVIDSATNKQSENVDTTMIATTEIYEGLL